jgi:HEAT repeat protein
VTPSLTVSPHERKRSAEVEALFRAGDIGELVNRLTDPSWTVRRAVVSALARLGAAAVAPLSGVITKKRDHEGRIAAAVDALSASLGNVEPQVLELLESADPAVVCDGAQILGRRRYRPALGRLAQLTESPNENVVMAAIEALGRIGGDAALDLLIDAVQSKSFFRAFPAIDVLGRTGDPRAVAPLAALLDEPHYGLEAARALGATGQPLALVPLAHLLESNDDARVRVAASAVVEIGERYTEQFGPNEVLTEGLAQVDRRAVDAPIAHALRGAEPAARACLCRVIGILGMSSAAPALIELLDADPHAAQAAAQALASLSADADPYLAAALRQSDSERRLLLLPIASRRTSLRSEVLACLRDTHPGVRAVACDALGKQADVSTVPALFELLRDPDARVSQAAVAAIQALGGAETERLALAAARSADPRERRSALRILSYFGWPSARDIFLLGMDDPDERIRDLAAVGLAAIDDGPSRQGLVAAASHASARTRAAAIRALGFSRSDGDVRDIVRRALDDEDGWVRYYACQALSRLGDEESAAAIARLLGDPAGQVRVAVIEALAHLRGEQALGALHEASQAADYDIRRAALLGLGSVKNAASLPYIEESLDSPDAATRLVGLSALSEFPAQAPLLRMRAALNDSDDAVRGAAVALLAARPGPEATTILIEGLRDPSLHERILGALSQPAEGRVATILVALRTAEPELAAPLVSALARARREDAAAALEEAFRFDNVYARRAVVPALAAAGTSAARKLLDAAMTLDSDVHVRRMAGAYLSAG